MRNEAMRILLVDDDEITNFLSKEVLQFHFKDAEIITVVNGEEAFDFLSDRLQAQQPLPHIMLLDINMPLMNGWEFLERLEAADQYQFSSISIFMYTSSVYFEDINRGKKHTLLKNILTKPLNNEGINEMISSLQQGTLEQRNPEQLN